MNAAPGLDRENLVACSNQYSLVLPDYQPTTGIGRFDILYFKPTQLLIITVKCKFVFERGERVLSRYEPVDPRNPSGPRQYVEGDHQPVDWPSEEEQDAWKKTFLTQLSSYWTDKHVFACKKAGWEAYRCLPVVRFIDVGPRGSTAGGDAGGRAHFKVRAFYIESNQMGTLCGGERGFKSCVKEDTVVVAAGDVKSYGARHEAGHMLGLDDEYWDGPSQPGPPAAHSSLVRAEFGHDVIRGQPAPNNIMGGTNLASPRVLPEHGVVFLEALRKVTRVSEWYFASASP